MSRGLSYRPFENRNGRPVYLADSLAGLASFRKFQIPGFSTTSQWTATSYCDSSRYPPLSAWLGAALPSLSSGLFMVPAAAARRTWRFLRSEMSPLLIILACMLLYSWLGLFMVLSLLPHCSPYVTYTTHPGFVWLMIARETLYYINVRQAYLLSPLYANRMSARTVLFTSVPSEFLEAKTIRRLFGERMKNYWVATDCKEIEKLVKERDKVAMKLEAAEVKLMKLANKESQKKGGAVHEEEHTGINGSDANGESGSVASRWVPPNKRPTHRLKFLVGKKVDTINWCRSELQRLDPEIKAEQAKHRAQEHKAVGSIFVEYYTQSDAQAAYQTTTHHLPLHMAPRFIGINPEDVIWDNLRIKWWERKVRYAATIAFVCALVIFWAIPVSFVGFLSNLDQLRNSVSWLAWLKAVPAVIFGVISGLLPSVLLAVLMALLPIVLRLMAKIGGCPSTAAIELRTQNFYFTFQVVQVFLVATISSAASAAISDIIKTPTSAVNILALKLPQASNLYISYFIVQGLTIASGSILQLVGLILFFVLGKVLDNTPRKVYKRWNSLSGLGWGTVFPVYTLIILIGMYSCPLSAPDSSLIASFQLWSTARSLP